MCFFGVSISISISIMIFTTNPLTLSFATANPISPNVPKANSFTNAILTQPGLVHKNLTAIQHAACWDPPDPPVFFYDCAALIRTQLGFPHDEDEPLTFSRRRSAAVQVPYYVRSSTKNCHIILSIEDDRPVTVITTFKKIKQEALGVAVECVVGGEHLGGFGWVGRQNGDRLSENQLLVNVVGIDESTRTLAAGGRRDELEGVGIE
ncbi:MAG: hypothetical protein L6R37_005912 [Teloschistes peruensis]|nr:MAG: hypothetical protein L6R37_005912 [Teloschistes peruensis]